MKPAGRERVQTHADQRPARTLAATVLSVVIATGCTGMPSADLPETESAAGAPTQAVTTGVDAGQDHVAPVLPGHDNLHATLYLQTAAEQKALTRLVYAAATARLDEALADRGWTAALEQGGVFADLPPAVIFDVDETVLDNSAYQATLIMKGISYTTKHWDTWVAAAQAPPVAGAVEFSRAAVSRGVTMLYLTNRRCIQREPAGDPCPQRAETIRNLVAAGFPQPDPANVYLRSAEFDFARDKQSRRAAFARNFRILMLFGDDLGDFVSGVKGDGVTIGQRYDVVAAHADRWGSSWFVLPNPTYGSWLDALGDHPGGQLRPWQERH